MIEQSTLERATRALADRAAKDMGAPPATDTEITEFAPYVRAALKAIHEPSRAMIDAGFVARDMERSPVAIWKGIIYLTPEPQSGSYLLIGAGKARS